MDWRIPSEKEINSLLIVAHPDDETIFCGGTMLTYPDWNWTVVCMTEKKGSDRYNEFCNAMETCMRYGIKIVSYKTLGQIDIDQGSEPIEKNIVSWRRVIEEQEYSPDITFTHNERGEYGHGAHKTLSLAVNAIFPNIWAFIYPKELQPYKKHKKEVSLSNKIVEQKKEIFNTCYKSQSYLWETFVTLMPYAFEEGREIFTSD